MAITQRTPAVSAPGVSATSITVTKPTGLADGDFVWIQLVANGGSGTISSAPAGFTTEQIGTVSNPRLHIAYKLIANAAGEGAWTFSYASGSVVRTAIAHALVGVDQTTPLDTAIGEANGPSGSDVMTVSGLTTVTNDALLLYGQAVNSSSSAQTPPSGMTLIAETTTKRSALSYEDRPTAGATGSRSGAAASNSLAWAAYMVAVRPATASAEVYETPSLGITTTLTAPEYVSVPDAVVYETPSLSIATALTAPEWSAQVEAYTTPALSLSTTLTAPQWAFAATYITPALGITTTLTAPTWTSQTADFVTPALGITTTLTAPTWTSASTWATPALGIDTSVSAPTWDAAGTWTTPALEIVTALSDPTWGYVYTATSPALALTLAMSAPTWQSVVLLLAATYTGESVVADRITGTIGIATRGYGEAVIADRITGSAHAAGRGAGIAANADRQTGTAGIG